MLHVYCSYHKWSLMVCQAFARGGNFPIVPPAPIRKGDVFMYGALRGLYPTLAQAMREGRNWYYADNGYFLPGKREESYFRVTRNAVQHDGSGEALDKSRWDGLGLKIEPWRQGGSHIVVCPPGRLFGATFGFNSDAWLEQTVAELLKHTDRELKIRAKVSWNDAKAPDIVAGSNKMPKTSVQAPLAEDLKGAWAVVTHSSNAAVEALLAGYPVFATNPCGAGALGLSDLSKIESPRMDGDRLAWARSLACHQWRLEEMRDGTCWRMLNAFA